VRALALLLLGGSALARPETGPAPKWGENPATGYESAQRFALEIKFTPYTPHIDQSDGLNGNTPFGDLFNAQSGPPPSRQPSYKLLTSLEFDYQFLHKNWGSLAIGHAAGIYHRDTHSFAYAADVTPGSTTMQACTVPNCVRSGDTTALNVMPLSLMLVYRFDYLARRYHIPLVPYMKVGLAYYIWWIEDGSPTNIAKVIVATNPDGTQQISHGYGGTFGFVLHPGLAFLLDIIDLKAARIMDAELGINHTYIFCELNYANINGFGQSNRLNLSDTMLNTGISFEF
jgi:hypothetical protein